MNDSDKVLTYEEAKQLCMKAFDGGATYGSESMRYGVNARAYDWEHWLERNEGLFKPTPTVEDVLREFALKVAGEECMTMRTGVVEEYAAKLRELLDYMTPIAWYAASERERDRMRELGVEVE